MNTEILVTLPTTSPFTGSPPLQLLWLLQVRLLKRGILTQKGLLQGTCISFFDSVVATDRYSVSYAVHSGSLFVFLVTISTAPVTPGGNQPTFKPVGPPGYPPVKPVGPGHPSKPVGPGPVKPVGQGLVKPTPGPVKPVGTGPVKPVGPGQVKPVGLGYPLTKPAGPPSGKPPKPPPGPSHHSKPNNTTMNYGNQSMKMNSHLNIGRLQKNPSFCRCPSSRSVDNWKTSCLCKSKSGYSYETLKNFMTYI